MASLAHGDTQMDCLKFFLDDLVRSRSSLFGLYQWLPEGLLDFKQSSKTFETHSYRPNG